MSLVLEFVSCVVKNLVSVPESVMDGWVQNPKALQEALTKALCPPVRWRKEDGTIYFDVVSDGTTGQGWIDRLEKKGIKIGDYAKSLLLSPDFKPTNGVKSTIAVLPGEMFFDQDRVTNKIRAEADRRKLTKPEAEVACLIREMFTDKEIEAMGLYWIIAMHEPIADSDGRLRLLGAGRRDGSWLDACCGGPGRRWPRGSGFAFVSQVSS